MYKFLIPFTACLLFLTTGFSQEKKEIKEERIKKEELPAEIPLFIKNYQNDFKRTKYYLEKDGTETTYEVKFKYRQHRYKIEFRKEGNLKDIEILLKEKELAKAVVKSMKDTIAAENERYKIEKIQSQYKANPEEPKQTLEKALDHKQHQPDTYELSVAVKNKGKLKRFEMIFGRDGKLLEKREIIRDSNDYLFF